MSILAPTPSSLKSPKWPVSVELSMIPDLKSIKNQIKQKIKGPKLIPFSLYQQIVPNREINANQVSRLLSDINHERITFPKAYKAKVWYVKDMIALIGDILRALHSYSLQKEQSYCDNVSEKADRSTFYIHSQYKPFWKKGLFTSTQRTLDSNYKKMLLAKISDDYKPHTFISYKAKCNYPSFNPELDDPYGETSFGYKRDLTREGIEPNPGPLTNKTRKNKSPKIKNNPVRRRPRNTNRPSRPVDNAQMDTTFMRPFNNEQPQSKIVKMSFSLGVQPFNNPSGPIIVENYYTNDGYDVLPGILTPTIPLINNEFAKYKFCKVIKVKFEYAISNLEQFPVDVHFYSSAQSMAAIFSSRSAVDSMNTLNKNLWSTTLSEQYGKCSQVRGRINVLPWRALADYKEYMSSNDFSFTQSANPARLTHASLVMVGGGSTLSNGVMVTSMLHFKFKFYDPLDINAPLFANLKQPDVPEEEIEVNGIKYIKA